ncbi:cathepsin B [Trichonephila clavipes]|nr:cathepsin B [Trichonephila clavipes]
MKEHNQSSKQHNEESKSYDWIMGNYLHCRFLETLDMISSYKLNFYKAAYHMKQILISYQDAGRNFEGVSIKHIKGLLGVHKDNHKYRLQSIKHTIPADLPDSFDAREQWPHCSTINEIKDQGSCGSCWFFLDKSENTSQAAEIVNGVYGADTVTANCAQFWFRRFRSGIFDVKDAPRTGRPAVENVGQRQATHLCSDSPETLGAWLLVPLKRYLTDTAFTAMEKCAGGFPGSAWQYWVYKGIVTGGLYNSHVGCQPYSVAACEHLSKGKRPPCGDIIDTPQCVHMCEKGYNASYTQDKHFGKKSYSIDNDEQQIKTEIFKNGPVEVAFTVYADFFT